MNRKEAWKFFVRSLAPLSLLAFALLASAASRPAAGAPQQAAQPATTQVTIDNFTFAPATLEISAGTKVTWINKDDVPHTVVSDDQETFKSKALDTDDEFSFTFSQPGTYKYFCSIHPKMTAQVVVK